MRRLSKIFTILALAAFAVAALYPLPFLLTRISVDGLREVFYLTPDYLMKFWKSLFLSVTITAGQTVLACLGGYGLAKFRFPCKNALYSFLILLMLLPLQVTLVPNYILLDKLGLIGSYAAVILPGVFSVFGVFLLTQIFSTVPDSLLEAARLDGANALQILWKIVIPYARSGIASLVVLNFADNWSMVEQPLVFLKDSTKYPLSVFLADVSKGAPEISFVCSLLAVLPVVLLFLHFRDALVSGIEHTDVK